MEGVSIEKIEPLFDVGLELKSCLKRAYPDSMFGSERRLMDGEGLDGHVGTVEAGESEGACWNRASRSVRASKADIIRKVEEEFRQIFLEGVVCKEGIEKSTGTSAGIVLWNRESILSTRLLITGRGIEKCCLAKDQQQDRKDLKESIHTLNAKQQILESRHGARPGSAISREHPF
jgi:hypothetical protein